MAFNDRYQPCVMMDTTKERPPQGDTQLFYVANTTQVLVSWRGTDFDRFHAPDLATDLTFRPVQPALHAQCAPSTECVDLGLDGRVHLGFRKAFAIAQDVYSEHFERLIPKAALGRQLFICGHSLGGALALIHAATLKQDYPVLYTYGMPRTFTLNALKGLSEIRHFRHVNDTDTISSVPPEADLDNHLYNLYGPLGTTLGFAWSMGQTLATNVIKFGDPYGHHGELAMLYRVEQHTQSRGSSYPAYRSKDGLGAPYYNTIKTRLPERPNLYVVPSLSSAENDQAEQSQRALMRCLTPGDRARFFQPHKNLKPGGCWVSVTT
ncbi:lipase family protein [Pseudomonas sp. 15A4]|uniref:lipase family protein n=1 Tax=Pseudomonas sp. 15A4 TaxID=2804761 RepID=UPI001F082476|nr:lipase family protein [Pseudomonas sp. 15A4]